MELPQFARAQTVMFYIDVRAEVRTRHALPAALQTGKRKLGKAALPLLFPVGDVESLTAKTLALAHHGYLPFPESS